MPEDEDFDLDIAAGVIAPAAPPPRRNISGGHVSSGRMSASPPPMEPPARMPKFEEPPDDASHHDVEIDGATTDAYKDFIGDLLAESFGGEESTVVGFSVWDKQAAQWK